MSSEPETPKKSNENQGPASTGHPSSKGARTSGILISAISVVVLVGFLLTVYFLIHGIGSGSNAAEVASSQAAPSGGAAPTVASNSGADAVAKGKDLYDASCIACHGQDGVGVLNLGKDLVHSTFAKGLSDSELLAFIKRGRDANDPLNTTHVPMPPKGGNPALNDAQIMDIIAYLRSLESK